MNNSSFTTISLKKLNKKSVFDYIYSQKNTCKANIARDLNMGLSTVTQNLKELENLGLICKNGFFDSTGGRKADALQIVKNARISIGIAILKHQIHIVATNLYGELVFFEIFKTPYLQSPDYYINLSKILDEFIEKNSIAQNDILGVCIATQGIVSNDGSTIDFGEILQNSQMKLSDFSSNIHYPCFLQHDSKSAGRLELWKDDSIQNAVIFLLNHNIGGAIISNGTVLNGDNMRSGTIEHIIVDTNSSETCYCKKTGCFETLCSIDALQRKAQMPIEDFFHTLRLGDINCLEIWRNYLRHLSIAISNLSLIIDGKIIISGFLSSFLTKDDLDILLHFINHHSTFDFSSDNLIVSDSGKLTQSIGASLYFTEKFLDLI